MAGDGAWRQKWIRMGEYVVPTACHGAGAGGRVVVGIFTSKRATQTTQIPSWPLDIHLELPSKSPQGIVLSLFASISANGASSRLASPRLASPRLPLSSSARMNDRVAMRTMMVLRCRSRKCKWPFPFVRLFLRGGRSRSLTFPKLSLRDNRSVKDGFLRIVPSLPPPPPRRPRRRNRCPRQRHSLVCRKVGDGWFPVQPQPQRKNLFFATLRFHLSTFTGLFVQGRE